MSGAAMSLLGVEGQSGTSHTIDDLLKIAKLYCCLKKPATVPFDNRGFLRFVLSEATKLNFLLFFHWLVNLQ